MFSVLDGKGEPGANCPSYDGARKEVDGACPHRHRGPFPASLGGSWYVVMFVDSASRLQRPYGTRDKSAAAILAVVKRFITDMGVLQASRSANGAEYTNHLFVERCNNLGIRRESTALYTPQQSGGERTLESLQDPDIRLDEVTGSTDAEATSLWMESLLWASECFNRSATAANDGWFSPHEIFMGTARRYRYCHFSSRLTTECPDSARVIPVPAYVIF